MRTERNESDAGTVARGRSIAAIVCARKIEREQERTNESQSERSKLTNESQRYRSAARTLFI
jgi:hypothetical protein